MVIPSRATPVWALEGSSVSPGLVDPSKSAVMENVPVVDIVVCME